MGYFTEHNFGNDDGGGAVFEIGTYLRDRIDKWVTSEIGFDDVDYIMGYVEAYKELICATPTARPVYEQVERWKKFVMQAWDAEQMDWPERRAVLIKTFEELDELAEPEINIILE